MSCGAKMITRDDYYMGIAMAVRRKANCLGRRVGAVVVKNNRIISTGYNGTPEGMTNCLDGGCVRCRDRQAYSASVGYDVCICVHAEQNALLTAARFGQQTLGASITSTMQPCFGCLKELLQAGIEEVRFLHPWDPVEAYHDPGLAQQYAVLRARFRVFAQVGDPGLDTDDLFAALSRA